MWDLGEATDVPPSGCFRLGELARLNQKATIFGRVQRPARRRCDGGYAWLWSLARPGDGSEGTTVLARRSVLRVRRMRRMRHVVTLWSVTWIGVPCGLLSGAAKMPRASRPNHSRFKASLDDAMTSLVYRCAQDKH